MLLSPGPAGRVKIVLGPRLVGKTELLARLVAGKKHLILTGADDNDLALLSDSKSSRKLAQDFPCIIIDEAQLVPGIGRVLERMADAGRADILVAGSRALDLAGDVGEPVAARFDTFNLRPFSLAELAANTSWIEVKRQIQERMIYGCLPAVVNDPRHAQQYLMDVADAVLYKDVFCLAQMRKPAQLTKLVRYLAAKAGSVVRYGSMAGDLGIENKTIERYVKALEACFVIKVVPSLSRNPTTEIKLGKKIYFYDNGIRNAVIRNFSPLPVRTDTAALWENLFLTERVKHHAFLCDGAEIYFWRTRTQHEVDFLEVLNGRVSAFDCTVDPKRKTTSIRAFERAYPDTKVVAASPDNIDAVSCKA